MNFRSVIERLNEVSKLAISQYIGFEWLVYDIGHPNSLVLIIITYRNTLVCCHSVNYFS